jgi:hypothetical protein
MKRRETSCFVYAGEGAGATTSTYLAERFNYCWSLVSPADILFVSR